MKRQPMFGAGVALVMGWFFMLPAQEMAARAEAEPLAFQPADLKTLNTLPDAELESFLKMLAGTPTIAPADLPLGGRAGTYYSLAHPMWPPLPGNVWQLPVWQISGSDPRASYYLLDDLGYEPGLSAGGQMLMSSAGGYQYGFQAPTYTTNDLWLEIIGKTNTSVSLVIHPPWTVTNGVYDLFSTTNLTPNVWLWALRTAAGETSLTVTEQPDPMNFFRLGTMQDSDFDGLTDAYENLVSKTDPNNADSDGDGIPDGWEVMLGLDPLTNDTAQSSTRANYTYDLADWLNQISGIESGSLVLDNEGNVTQANQ